MRRLYAGRRRHYPAAQEERESQAAPASVLLPIAPALLHRSDYRRHGRLAVLVSGREDLRLGLARHPITYTPPEASVREGQPLTCLLAGASRPVIVRVCGNCAANK